MIMLWGGRDGDSAKCREKLRRSEGSTRDGADDADGEFVDSTSGDEQRGAAARRTGQDCQESSGRETRSELLPTVHF